MTSVSEFYPSIKKPKLTARTRWLAKRDALNRQIAQEIAQELAADRAGEQLSLLEGNPNDRVAERRMRQADYLQTGAP